MNQFNLGKLPAKIDKRTLKFGDMTVAENLPVPPDVFDVDSQYPSISFPIQMFANDKYGDCVIAGRANQTMRFEAFEQGVLIPITDGEVLYEYWKEGGWNGCWCSTKPDNGLYLLDSLKHWRQDGWKANKQVYDIYAYSAIDYRSQYEIKVATYLFNGVYGGFMVPQSCLTQFNNSEIWDVVENSPVAGGHCVYICGYNEIGPICLTWGKRQQMTWNFMFRYFDEAYAIIDDKNSFTNNSRVDIDKLEKYLNSL